MASRRERVTLQVWQSLRVLLPLAVFLAFWELVVKGDARLIFLFASPSLVFRRLIHDLAQGDLPADIGVTALETGLGFLLGCAVGSFVGLTLWFSEITAKIARPYVIALGSIPIFAIAPMMIIWFGTGLWAKIMMAALSTVVVAIFQAYEGARNVDPDLIALLRTFGATKFQTYRKVIVPAALVWVVVSYKLNIGFALLGAFIGEFISSERGLGHYILRGGGLYDVPEILSGVTCIIGVSVGMSILVGLAERLLLPWRHRPQTPSGVAPVQEIAGGSNPPG